MKKAAEIAKAYLESRNAEEHGPDHLEVEDDHKYIAGGTVIERLPRLGHHELGGINPATPFLSTLSLNARDNVSRGKKFFNKGLLQDKTVWSNENLSLAVTRKSLSALNRPLSRPDIFYSGSTQRLNTSTEKTGRSHSALGSHGSYRASQLMLSTAALPTTDSYVAGNWSDGITSALKLLFDFELMHSPTFHVLAISGFLTLTCFFVPFMFISAMSQANGIEPEKAKYLLSILGGVNVIGRILCG